MLVLFLVLCGKKLKVNNGFCRSDAWASRESVVADRDEFVEGAIAIQPLMRELPGTIFMFFVR